MLAQQQLASSAFSTMFPQLVKPLHPFPLLKGRVRTFHLVIWKIRKLSTYYLPGTLLGTVERTVNKTEKLLPSQNSNSKGGEDRDIVLHKKVKYVTS